MGFLCVIYYVAIDKFPLSFVTINDAMGRYKAHIKVLHKENQSVYIWCGIKKFTMIDT